MDFSVFEPKRHSSICYEELTYITAGKSSLVYAIDEQRILKQYHDEDGKDVEREAYIRLSPHPCVARYMGTEVDGSIILERGRPLRHICQNEQIPLERKIRWASQAAEGYLWIHNNNIIQSDVGLHNMILAQDGHLKIIDFEGSSIDGKPADSLYEWFSHQRSTPVSVQTDVFAYGCALYEMMTGKTPYYEHTSLPNRSTVIEQLYADGHFPDVADVPLGYLVKDCWEGRLVSMKEVLRALTDDNRSAGAPLLGCSPESGSSVVREVRSPKTQSRSCTSQFVRSLRGLVARVGITR